MGRAKLAFILCLFLVLAACSSRMSDDVYERITTEFTDEIVVNILETDDLQFDEQYEEYVMMKLNEVAAKHNYTADDYLKKAKEKGDDWDTIWEGIEIRIFQLMEMYLDEMEEYESDVDAE